MSANEEWAVISFNNRDPVYLQVVRHFKERIATGLLLPNQTIPSRRELGALLKINPNTVQKAYKEMEEQQLIVTEPNSHSRITSDAELLSRIRMELASEAVQVFVTAVRKINIGVDELVELVRREYAEGGERHD
ncbi:GntR family transcriptional regulator [Paenibacillus sp. HB172176]|uniref:GntR family transcriptional regulator n=1 Tax=Paenibacillus sp. HB172176 TaxID=2493690 RepID=UPI00143CA553|nr:GntR family transcriptional regulator [Paenibacillus sp. HB172176]